MTGKSLKATEENGSVRPLCSERPKNEEERGKKSASERVQRKQAARARHERPVEGFSGEARDRLVFGTCWPRFFMRNSKPERVFKKNAGESGSDTVNA